MKTNRPPTAIIVADSHFHLRPDPAEQQRVGCFLELMDLACAADHLVLLGDIFDFWFDYPHFRLSGYDRILSSLDKVYSAGTKIHFIGGNHDIWAAGYLHERHGSEPAGQPLILQLGDLKILFDHGDGLLGHDWLYSTFRSMVRTKPGILLAKSLHPEILYALSTWLSGKSRNATRDEAVEIEQKAEAWLAKQVQVPWDLMVIGHVHHRFKISAQGRNLYALHGWFDHLDYGVIQNGELTVLDFFHDPMPEL